MTLRKDFDPNRTCELCGKPYLATHVDQRFCSNRCGIIATPKPQNLTKYNITLADLEDADNQPLEVSRLKYVANKFGCDPATVSYRAKILGYKWKLRPQRKRVKTILEFTKEDRKSECTACVVCGEGRFVEAAHLVPRRRGGKGSLENLIPLCPTHHRMFDNCPERFYPEEREKLLGFLRDKYRDYCKEELYGIEIERFERVSRQPA